MEKFLASVVHAPSSIATSVLQSQSMRASIRMHRGGLSQQRLTWNSQNLYATDTS